MPRSAAQRIAQYNARMSAPLLSEAYLAVNDLMKANFAAYANYFVPMQDATVAFLGSMGIPAGYLFGYHAFTQEMLRVWPRHQGLTRDIEVCALINKYVALGLDLSVLQGLVLNVWGSPAVPACMSQPCGDEVSDISPAAGTIDVPLDGEISWLTDPRATSVDVFLDDVNPPVTQVVTAGRVNSYTYAGLTTSIPYYWRVDVTFDDFANPGSPCVVTGTVHTFTTV